MKYILLCTGALILCVLIGVLGEMLLRGKKNRKILTRVLTAAGLSAAALCAIAGSYLSVYYHAQEEALACMNSDGTVTVTKDSGAWFFDGPGTENAVIFYPGAKVQAEAYAKLLYKIAAGGEDCYLLDVPFHMAVLDADGAKRIIDTGSHMHWYTAGHSLGGTTAALFDVGHPEITEGVILFAAYPTKPLESGERLLSIYGSEDLVLNKEEYEKGKRKWPADARECVIEGGNHSGFGDYGMQKGDGEASVPNDAQQEAAAQAVIQFLEEK